VFGDLIIINICQGVSLIEVKLAYRWILARRCSLPNRQVLGTQWACLVSLFAFNLEAAT
jgi:hypothetical protein